MEHQLQIAQATDRLTGQNRAEISSSGTQEQKARRHFSGAEIVTILKRHIVNGEKVSDLCQEYDIAPNQFYRWQKELFDNGAAIFERRSVARENARIRKLEEQNTLLAARLAKKDAVIAEAVEEIMHLKKSLGEL